MSSAILGSPYAASLAIAKAVVKKPLLVKTDEGAKVCGNQYVPELETIILEPAESLPEIEFEEGLALINSLLDFWIWKEPEDRARAWAELLTYAMLIGGFLKRPIPAMLITADMPKAGKTFWHSMVSWTYGSEPDPHVSTKNGGAGNIEEQLRFGLINGVPFFFIDELDGTVKNTFINAFLTGGDETIIRTVYGRFVNVPTDKTMVQLAGVKGFVVDPQLATRVIPIRIMKPADAGEYHWAWPDGTLLRNWMRTEGPKVLSSVYAVIKKWAELGFPQEGAKSMFPSWEMPINGLLKHVLNLPLCTVGLEEAQGEISSIAQAWWPKFFQYMVEEDLVWTGEGIAKYFMANTLQLICDNEAGIGVPGANQELRDQARIRNHAQQIHTLIGELPHVREYEGRDPEKIFKCGEFFILRYKRADTRHARTINVYVLARSSTIPSEIRKFVLEDHTFCQD
jgi:hypothetical protein